MNILNETDTDGICIRYASDEKPDPAAFDFHIHDRCEIYYFISGDAEYLVEGSVYRLERGNLLIMSPGEAHCVRIRSRQRYERYAVNFPLSLFDGIDPERRVMRLFTEKPLGSGNLFYDDTLTDKFSRMCADHADNYERLLTARAYILDILLNLTCGRGTEKGEQTAAAQEILRYVNAHLFEELTVNALAEHFYLSTSQFGRIFRQATGASPREYINAKRLINARVMISDGISAKQAAEDCGFKDYSVFYRSYVKRYGESTKRTQG